MDLLAIGIVVIVILGGVSSFVTSSRLTSQREARWRRFEKEKGEEGQGNRSSNREV